MTSAPCNDSLQILEY